jgi:hypothetical protein
MIRERCRAQDSKKRWIRDHGSATLDFIPLAEKMFV